MKQGEKKIPSTQPLPIGTSQFYKNLALSMDPLADPIAAQIIPQTQEEVHLPWESADPLADQNFEVTPRLIHHYHDRALLLVNDRCSTYCRHCFRRHFTGVDQGRLREEELEQAAQYIKNTPAIREILLSGGDPLMLPDQHLFHILSTLQKAREDLIFRICTRIPVVLPARITPELAQGLGQFPGLWCVTQVNHPQEITAEFKLGVMRLMREGIPTLNQAVLLKGVNDRLETLEELFRGLLKARVKPYYLFQGDLAQGTSHFRVNLKRGLQLMKELRSRLSGMAIPRYALDLPNKGGKVLLHESMICGEEEGFYQLKGPQGKIYLYPIEDL